MGDCRKLARQNGYEPLAVLSESFFQSSAGHLLVRIAKLVVPDELR
jgi:hypothetical protein